MHAAEVTIPAGGVMRTTQRGFDGENLAHVMRFVAKSMDFGQPG